MTPDFADMLGIAILTVLAISLAFLFDGDPDLYDLLLNAAHQALGDT